MKDTSRPLHIHTPTLWSYALSEALGTPTFLKMEAYQPTGSFKIRGIGLACQRAVAEGRKRFLSSSGGNAGYAVAYAGRELGIPTTVVLPKTAPSLMKSKISELGAEVMVVGDSWDHAHAFSLDLAKSTGAAYIPPFDLPEIWEGHSTLVDELEEKPEAIVVSVGGGGLLLGILMGLERRGWNDVKVFSVETEGTSSMAQSLAHGSAIEIPKAEGVAHSLGARRVSQTAFDWAMRKKVVPLIVTDDEAKIACVRFANDHYTLVEAACGTALAPAYNARVELKKFRSVLIIACGGLAISVETIQSWAKEYRL